MSTPRPAAADGAAMGLEQPSAPSSVCLAERYLLLVRPEDPDRGPDRLALALRQAGAEVFPIASTRFGPPADPATLNRAREDLRQGGRWDWIAFTSPRSVAALAPETAPPWPNLRCAAVGTTTAAALQAAGQAADLCQDQGGAEALGRLLSAHLRPGERVLLPAGDLADDRLASALTESGARVQVLEAYRTLPRRLAASEREALAAGADALIFTSGSGAAALGPLLEARLRNGLPGLWVALGPRTAAELRRLGLPVDAVAAAPSGSALVAALATALGCLDGGDRSTTGHQALGALASSQLRPS